MSEYSFACDMSALGVEQRTKHGRLLKDVFGAVRSVRAVAEGYSLRIDAERLVDAATFVLLERRCCPFFDFALELERGMDTFELHITGPAGVGPFIEAEFASALPHDVRFPAQP